MVYRLSSFWYQLIVLIRRNWQLRWNRPVWSVLELIIPLVLIWYQIKHGDEFKNALQTIGLTSKSHYPNFEGLTGCDQQSINASVLGYVSRKDETIQRYMDSVTADCSIQTQLFASENDLKSKLAGQVNLTFGITISEFNVTQHRFVYKLIGQRHYKDDLVRYVQMQTVLAFQFIQLSTKAEQRDLYVRYTFPRHLPESLIVTVTKSSNEPEPFDYFLLYSLLTFANILTVCSIVCRLISDKRSNVDWLLKSYGLYRLTFWLSHLLDRFVVSLVIGSIIVLIYMALPDLSPLRYADLRVFSVIYIVNCYTVIVMALLITTVIEDEFVGSIGLALIWSILAWIPTVVKGSKMESIILTFLWPQGCLWFGLNYLLSETLSKHGSVSNLYETTNQYDIENKMDLKLVLIVNFVMWSLIAGLVLNWNFFRTVKVVLEKILPKRMVSVKQEETGEIFVGPGFRFSDLSKQDNGQKLVINDLVDDLKKGQITVIFGQTESGKTETINVIRGHIESKGDSRFSYNERLKSLTFCPQVIMFIPGLTVRQHFDFFMDIQGKHRAENYSISMEMMKKIGLSDQATILVDQLSDDAKRKLQIGLALLSGRGYFIFDEPTKGLTVESRQLVWELLMELKSSGAAICISSSLVEEAIYIGDFIVILTEKGTVTFSGLLSDLKEQSARPNLCVAKKKNDFDERPLKSLVEGYFPKYTVNNHLPNKIVYSLNPASIDKSRLMSTLGKLSGYLSKNKKNMGIESYNIELNTIEDLIDQKNQVDEESQKNLIIDRLDPMEMSFKRCQGMAWTSQQIYGLIFKRLNHVRHLIKSIKQRLVWIGFIIVAVLVLFGVSTNFVTETALPKSLNLSAVSTTDSDNATLVVTLMKDISRRSLVNVYDSINKARGIKETVIVDTAAILDRRIGLPPKRNYIYGLLGRYGNGSTLDAWYNPHKVFSMSLAVDACYNSFLRSASKNNASLIEVIYETIDSRLDIRLDRQKTIALLTPSIIASVGFAVITAYYVKFPSIEFFCKTQFIQKLSGLSNFLFWFGHFIFDFICHLILTLILLIIILILDIRLKIFSNYFKSLSSTFLLFVCFGLAAIPFAYLISGLGLKSTSKQHHLTWILVIVTVLLTTIASVSVLLGDVATHNWLPLSFFPPFAVSFGLSKITVKSLKLTQCERFKACDFVGPALFETCHCNSSLKRLKLYEWSENGLEGELNYLFIAFLVFSILGLTSMETNWQNLWHCIGRATNAATRRVSKHWTVFSIGDIKAERNHAARAMHHPDPVQEALIVYNLSKDFNERRESQAVDGISFTVHRGECFGLLGLEGSGRSTTIRMLTGDLIASHGEARIKPWSLRKAKERYQKSIGYCPQEDALVDSLTPKEMLTLFCRLKGVTDYDLRSLTEHLIDVFGLFKFKETACVNLERGVRRRVSLAIAIIGRPKVLFIDEPTRGVDRESQLIIWSVLSQVQSVCGITTVIASGSLEECEHLCSRIGVMVKGKLIGIGLPKQLRDKFASGVTLKIILDESATGRATDIIKITNFFDEAIPSSIIKAPTGRTVNVYISTEKCDWPELLEILSQACQVLPIAELGFKLVSGLDILSLFDSAGYSEDIEFLE